MNANFSRILSTAIVAENARGHVAVIPDIKCFSPKDGDLLRGRNPIEMAQCLVSYGAPALSVVTQKEHFGGSAELLQAITDVVNVPVLRKDFITNEDMLKETVALGAAAVLLICATTDKKILTSLYDKAIELGLEPFVEAHTKEEMEFAVRLKARLIGINNRDILAFERDNGGAAHTAELALNVPAGALLISESGILSPDDAKLVSSVGTNAILAGTALWQADNLKEAYRLFCVERRREPCVQS
ncbi:MAG: indole-3-glycerol-phosphate synthase [Dehalococcoidia bacterium]|nr:indole-3-glycerol-phosphate synthase [Dehalococcoidia bacterium]